MNPTFLLVLIIPLVSSIRDADRFLLNENPGGEHQFIRNEEGIGQIQPGKLTPGGEPFVKFDGIEGFPTLKPSSGSQTTPVKPGRIVLSKKISQFKADGSGVKFVGIGYNLLTGNPEGGSHSTGGVDPGLLLTRKIFKLSPGDNPKELIFEDRHSCVNVKKTYVFFGTKTYQEKLKREVTTSGKGNLWTLGFEFSLSNRYEMAQTETNKQGKVCLDEQNVCNWGRIRYAEELAQIDGYSVTRNFASAVCNLPLSYDKNTYMRFLDEWGTHVTLEVEMGNRTIKRSETSRTEMIKHFKETSGSVLKSSGSFLGFSASLQIDKEKIKQMDLSEMTFWTNEYTLYSGRADRPEPIHLKVKTLITALHPKYWSTAEIKAVCPTASTQLETKSNNLVLALEGYAKYKGALQSTDPDLKVPITWPEGTYGLYKTKSGCPAANVSWSEGWRVQDCENGKNRNSFSNPLHLSGIFNRDIKTEFCMKGNPKISDYDVDWPRGEYCILKYGNCPTGFGHGWVIWDDEDFMNKNGFGGSLPDGHYDRNTRIDYCCRSDSRPSKPIFLPTEKPFILLRYKLECQHVHGMNVREEVINWDNEDSNNKDSLGGAHPYESGGNRNQRLHFCYYTKA